METAKIFSEIIYKYGKCFPETKICFLSNCLIDLLYNEHLKIEDRIEQQKHILFGYFDRKFYIETSIKFATLENYLNTLIPLLDEIDKTEISEEWQEFLPHLTEGYEILFKLTIKQKEFYYEMFYEALSVDIEVINQRGDKFDTILSLKNDYKNTIKRLNVMFETLEINYNNKINIPE